jgi:threonyl-tRNA synthetase
LGDSNNDSLQRIYGISFPDKKQLAEYKTFLAEAAKRDHRKIGRVSTTAEWSMRVEADTVIPGARIILL